MLPLHLIQIPLIGTRVTLELQLLFYVAKLTSTPSLVALAKFGKERKSLELLQPGPPCSLVTSDPRTSG